MQSLQVALEIEHANGEARQQVLMVVATSPWHRQGRWSDDLRRNAATSFGQTFKIGDI